MYLANVAGGVTFTAVGHQFGRNRSTVAHACALVEDLRDDPRLDEPLILLEAALRGSFRLPNLGGPLVPPSVSRKAMRKQGNSKSREGLA